MAFHDDDDYPISISVVPPFESPFDPYGYPPSSLEETFVKSMLQDLDDALLGPSSYSPESPFSDAYSPASTDNSLSPDYLLEALSLHSPAYEHPFGTSPLVTVLDDFVEAQSTVSPRDVMGDTSVHSSALMSPFFAPSSNGHPIEPLFGAETDEHETQDLIVLDKMTRDALPETSSTTSSALFGAQKADLSILIPVAQPSSHSVPIHLSPSPSPGSSASLYPPSPANCYSPNTQSPSSRSLHSPSTSMTPVSPSPLASPQSTIGAQRPRRRTRASSTSSTASLRHHPYVREPPAAQEAEHQISGPDYEEIVSFLKSLPDFAHWDFETRGLPDIVREVVGSKKTREASENRRTQGGEFLCPLPGCGSTITKKHNLRHHIISHFVFHAFKCEVCHQGFGHQCSLVRHQKGSCQTVTEEPEPVRRTKRGKRSRRT